MWCETDSTRGVPSRFQERYKEVSTERGGIKIEGKHCMHRISTSCFCNKTKNDIKKLMKPEGPHKRHHDEVADLTR